MRSGSAKYASPFVPGRVRWGRGTATALLGALACALLLPPAATAPAAAQQAIFVSDWGKLQAAAQVGQGLDLSSGSPAYIAGWQTLALAGRRTRHGAGPAHVCEETGVADVHRVLERERPQVLGEPVDPERLVQHVERERCTGVRRLEVAAHPLLGQAFEQLTPEVDHGGAELARALGIPIEIRDGLGALRRHPATLSGSISHGHV